MQSLTKTQLEMALEVGHSFYAKSYASGGIMDTKAKLDKQVVSVSGLTFKLVKAAQEAGGKDNAAVMAYFVALFSAAEQAIKEDGKSENVRDIVPHWGRLKSEAKRALKAGVDVTELKSHSAMNKARIKADEAASGESSGTDDGDSPSDIPTALSERLTTIGTLYAESGEPQRVVILADLDTLIAFHKEANATLAVAPDATAGKDVAIPAAQDEAIAANE